MFIDMNGMVLSLAEKEDGTKKKLPNNSSHRRYSRFTVDDWIDVMWQPDFF